MNNLQLALAKLSLKLREAESVEVTHVNSSLGQTYEVIIFSEKQLFTLGQSLPFIGTVIINRLVLNKPRLLDYVLVHEFAHAKQCSANILAAIALIFMTFVVLCLLAMLGTFLSLIVHFDVNTVLSCALILSVALCSLLIGVLCSWFMEYKADSKAISVLGQKRLDEALVEKKELCPNPSKMLIVITFLTHPPIKLTLKIYKLLHGSIPS